MVKAVTLRLNNIKSLFTWWCSMASLIEIDRVVWRKSKKKIVKSLETVGLTDRRRKIGDHKSCLKLKWVIMYSWSCCSWGKWFLSFWIPPIYSNIKLWSPIVSPPCRHDHMLLSKINSTLSEDTDISTRLIKADCKWTNTPPPPIIAPPPLFFFIE